MDPIATAALISAVRHLQEIVGSLRARRDAAKANGQAHLSPSEVAQALDDIVDSIEAIAKTIEASYLAHVTAHETATAITDALTRLDDQQRALQAKVEELEGSGHA